jgi:N6-adenosine-specific RNA methylase IME4
MTETSLVTLDALKREIAQANDVTEVKDLRDKAQALRGYVKARGDGLEAQNKFAELKLIAERRAGEMLAGMHGLGSQGGDRRSSSVVTLEKLGVNKVHSSRWQLEASVPEEEFLRYVAEMRAAGEEITSAGLLRLAKKQDRAMRREEAKEAAQNLPEGIFNVILADPPWEYDNRIEKWGPAELHYPTMSVEDICGLIEIFEVADNAALFLWATNPFLLSAFYVIDAWGFDYKTNIVWIKTGLKRPGSGWYVRGRHELCLICTPIGSVITGPVGDHSEKPDELYEIIERLYPGCSYLELFARENREGWTSWGSDLS